MALKSHILLGPANLSLNKKPILRGKIPKILIRTTGPQAIFKDIWKISYFMEQIRFLGMPTTSGITSLVLA